MFLSVKKQRKWKLKSYKKDEIEDENSNILFYNHSKKWIEICRVSAIKIPSNTKEEKN